MFHLFLLRSSDFDLRYSFPNAIRLGVPAYSYLGNVSGIHENTGDRVQRLVLDLPAVTVLRIVLGPETQL